MASAYGTLADGGTEHPAYFVTKVTDANGKVLFQHDKDGKRVLDAKVVNDTTLSMEQVASSSGLALTGGRPVAAKTGTVGIANTLNSSDAWTVGFTPQVSVASWAGSDSLAPIYNDAGTSMYGRQNPGEAWQLFMNAYLAKAPVIALPTKQEIGTTAVQSSSPPRSSSTPPPSSSTPPPSSSTPPPSSSSTPPPSSPTPPPSTTPPPSLIPTVPISTPHH
jgi:membrane peptidoglycan carboxypeptidase